MYQGKTTQNKRPGERTAIVPNEVAVPKADQACVETGWRGQQGSGSACVVALIYDVSPVDSIHSHYRHPHPYTPLHMHTQTQPLSPSFAFVGSRRLSRIPVKVKRVSALSLTAIKGEPCVRLSCVPLFALPCV